LPKKNVFVTQGGEKPNTTAKPHTEHEKKKKNKQKTPQMPPAFG